METWLSVQEKGPGGQTPYREGLAVSLTSPWKGGSKSTNGEATAASTPGRPVWQVGKLCKLSGTSDQYSNATEIIGMTA